MRYKVVGPPGTGKTRRLLMNVQRYVDKGVPHKKDRLLCIYKKSCR